jgi:hypothetical protein
VDDLAITENALDAMGEGERSPGPQPFARALHDAASRYRVPLGAPEVERLVQAAALPATQEDQPVHCLLARKVQRWDALPGGSWVQGTQPRSRARRALILERLALPRRLSEGFDELVPVIDLEEPVVIARDHRQWLDAPRRANCPFFYWNAYRRRLASQGWSERSILELDQVTTLTLERMEDPARIEARRTQGLIVGFVQSGKTANFTGVIAKAADLGYRLIIVLAGTLDLLRNQTQRRLDRDVIGREIIASHHAPGEVHDYATDIDWPSFVSHGGLPSAQGHFDWQRLTRADGDYRRLRHGLEALEFVPSIRGRRLNDPANLARMSAKLMVVKKNASVLRNLTRDLAALRARLGDVPALVIDDESDQAGVNVRRGGAGRTAVNDAIVGLLASLKRVQYVAYTATPYANVLVDPTDLEDIFPRDFIIPLARPDGYMGARDFYDRGPEVPQGFRSNERAFLRDVTGDDDDEENLPRAMDLFMLAGMLKIFRAERGVRLNRHHTMLIHRSHLQEEHRQDLEMVENLFGQQGYATGAAHVRLKTLFESDLQPVASAQEPGLPFPESYAEVKTLLGRVLDRIGPAPAAVINGDPEFVEQLPDFDGVDDVWRILVGGTKLSRGYTIEGLTISYYRRRVRTADTLMQMGRWFGFRHGYRDLVRVFLGTSEPDGPRGTMNLRESFESICLDEEDFREDLRKYAQGPSPITPEQVPPLVASRLLLPTAKNKMWHAVLVALNYGEQWVERTLVPTDSKGNWTSLETRLRAYPLSRTDLAAGPLRTSALVTTWTSESMLTFLDGFEWSGPGRTLFEPVLNFLRGEMGDPEIDDWRVVIPQIQKPDETATLAGHRLAVVRRARDSRSGDGRFKVFTDPKDRLLAGYLAGMAAPDASTELAGLRRPRQGVMLVYPCRDKNDTGLPAVGFALAIPRNSLPQRTKFSVSNAASDPT